MAFKYVEISYNNKKMLKKLILAKTVHLFVVHLLEK